MSINKILDSTVERYFFFQGGDGIRDSSVTGVQTCALPIWRNHMVADGTFMYPVIQQYLVSGFVIALEFYAAETRILRGPQLPAQADGLGGDACIVVHLQGAFL